MLPLALRKYAYPWLAISILALSPVMTEASSNQKTEVVFLNPDADHWFWIMTQDVMLSAAENLGLSLEVINTDRSHLAQMNAAEAIIARPSKPSYIITGNEKGSAIEVIKRANEAGIYVLILNNGFVKKRERQHMGLPTQRYNYWIGQLIPDNFSAGYQMAVDLIEAHRKKNTPRPIKIVALAGTHNTHASDERVRGMQAALNQYNGETELLQVVPGDWTYSHAKNTMTGLLQRYPRIDAVWAVNDSVALGAIDAAAEHGLKAGENILVSGCGWYAPALESIEKKQMLSSIGGHFIDAAWAMVVIRDHSKGIDNAYYGPDQKMLSLSQDNVVYYRKFIENSLWRQLDFRPFSKHFSPQLSEYKFDFKLLMQQVEK